MTLVAGAKLGPYEVLAPLGAGGIVDCARGVPAPSIWKIHGNKRHQTPPPAIGTQDMHSRSSYSTQCIDSPNQQIWLLTCDAHANMLITCHE